MPTRSRTRTGLVSATAALLVTLLGASLAVPAAADDDLNDQRSSTQAQQRAVNDALSQLEGDLEDTGAELSQAFAELEGIKAAIPLAEQELAAAQDKLAGLQRDAEIIAQRLADAQAEEARITGQIETNTARTQEIEVAIGRMARDAYKGDMAASSLSAVLNAQSTDDFIEQSALADTALRTQTQALREMEQLNGVNRNQQARLAAVRDQITQLKNEADAKVAQAEEARAQAEARKAELDQLLADQQTKTALIEAKRDEQLRIQAEYEAQQAALAQQLAEIIRLQDEERRRNQQNGPAGNPGHVLAYPVANPYVTSEYGWRVHPIYGYLKLHAGIDFRAYCGTAVYAAASGSVQWARLLSGYGNQVMVNHGYYNGSSLMTSYNHLSRFAVTSGQSVSQGELLGYSGTTGTSTACHLHFEVYVNGATQNPRDYL